MQEQPRQRSVFNSYLRNGFQSLPFLGVVFFIFLTTFPPLEVETEISLPIHMAQHILIVLSGVLIAYPLYRSGKFSKIKSVKTGLLAFAVVATLIVFWHLPTFWDAAVLNPLVHIAEHFSFLMIGLLIGGFVPMLPDNFKMLALVLAISAHMFYGFALYLITTPIYPLYPVSQQSLLGLLLFAPSPAYLGGFLYITLSRESRALEEGRGNTAHIPKPSRKRLERLSIATISLLMIFLLCGYLALTAVAIDSSTPQNTANVPIVYIVETPINWQYSPQNITVLMGLNNTVEWVSHSLTYDTVTSTSGNFSHAFSPGDTFEYTFPAPGIYDYYCIYHPWMHGTVVVLASG